MVLVKGVERSSGGLIRDTISKFAWRDEEEEELPPLGQDSIIVQNIGY
jgi:hypothetical protein